MSSVFYRQPTHQYPIAVRGEGIYLYDRDGKEYLDGSAVVRPSVALATATLKLIKPFAIKSKNLLTHIPLLSAMKPH